MGKMLRHTEFVAALCLLLCVSFAFSSLIGFDPYRSLQFHIGGLEGAFFSPLNSNWPMVFFVVAIEIWRRRRVFFHAAAEPRRAWLLALFIFIALGLYLWGTFVEATDLLIPSLSFTLIACAYYVGGVEGLRRFTLPAFLLLMAVPIPAILLNAMMYPLQLLSARLAAGLVWLTSVPFTLSGDVLVADHRVFQVIESCSGLRSISTLMLSCFLLPSRYPRRGIHLTLLVLSAPVLGLFLNAVRIVMIVMTPESWFGSSHTVQGILVLVVGILLLAGEDALLEKQFHRGKGGGTGLKKGVRAGVLTPKLLVLSLVFLMLGSARALVPRWNGEQIHHRSIQDISRLDIAKPLVQKVDADFLGTVAFTQRSFRRYSIGNSYVDVFIGVNNRVKRFTSLVSKKTVVPGAGFVLGEDSLVRLSPPGRVIHSYLAKTKVSPSKEDEVCLVYHWYLGVRSLPEEVLRAFLSLDYSPFRRRDREVVVRLVTPLGQGIGNRAEAEHRLQRLAEEISKNLSEEPPAWGGEPES